MKTVFLLFVGLILSCSSGNKQKNDLEKANLKGNVKSLREVSFNAVDNFGEITKGDRGGEGWFGPDGFYNKYNNKGFLIERIEEFVGNGDSLIFKEIYKYDGKGYEIEKNQSAPNGKSGKETSKYDDKGNIIELNRYYPVDSLDRSWKYSYKYDDKGNIIEENTYTNGSLEGQLVTYKYDDKDNLTEASVYTGGSLHWKNTFKYDDKGNKIEKNMYSYDGSLSGQEINKYDDKGNKIESSRINPYSSNYKDTYKYDDKDNLIEKMYLSDNGSSSQEIYQYDYDENNNWIKRIHFKDDIPKHIVEREIAYYF